MTMIPKPASKTYLDRKAVEHDRPLIRPSQSPDRNITETVGSSGHRAEQKAANSQSFVLQEAWSTFPKDYLKK